MEYIAIACNPGTQVIRLMNGSSDREELLAQAKRKQKGESYQVFAIDNYFGKRIYNWLTDLGVEKRETTAIVSSIGNTLTSLIKRKK